MWDYYTDKYELIAATATAADENFEIVLMFFSLQIAADTTII